MIRMHFTHKYLLQPQHPVTVNVIGAGGTGSQVITLLGRMNAALTGLEHPGLFVSVYDPDDVSHTNIGRQLFSASEIGLNKAECLVSKMNAYFGTDWRAVPEIYPKTAKDVCELDIANIYITCTDNITSRFELSVLLKALESIGKKRVTDHHTPLYWLDFGNRQATGQAVLGTIPKTIEQPESEKFETVGSLPFITDMGGYDNLTDEESGPSCSLAEALHSQDLFINSILSQHGIHLLWRMLRHGMTEYRGLYLNLDRVSMNPIGV